MSRPKIRRRSWLIDKEIQVGLGVRLALCMAGYMALFLAVSLVDPIVTLVSSESTVMARNAAGFEIQRFLITMLGPLLFATACMILHTVLILHRLAGPVLRIRRGFEGLEERDLTGAIHLRKGDLLGSVAEKHNDALDALKADVAALRTEIGSLSDLVADGAQTDDGLRDGLRTHLARAEAILARYRLEGSSPDGTNSPVSEEVAAAV